MPEGIEIETHGDQGYRYTLPVSLTISILAVLVAAVSLLGHRAHTEELLRQSQASDQWAYYQAKNIRLHEMEGVIDLMAALAPQERKETQLLRDKYLEEVKRYDGDKEEIGDKAKELERERDLLSRRADRFDAGEALLEVALVICSITLLTRRRAFWFAGMIVGTIGVLVGLTGLVVR